MRKIELIILGCLIITVIPPAFAQQDQTVQVTDQKTIESVPYKEIDVPLDSEAKEMKIPLGFTFKPLCTRWTERMNGQGGSNSSVCTDLLEGIPLDVNKSSGNSCEPQNGGNWVYSKTVNGEQYMQPIGIGKLCYAVISPTGIKSIAAYVGLIYNYSAWVIGILGVLGIIIAGLRITLGSAVPSEVADGKKMITKIIGGIIFFFLIGAILRTLNPNFFVTSSQEDNSAKTGTEIPGGVQGQIPGAKPNLGQADVPPPPPK